VRSESAQHLEGEIPDLAATEPPHSVSVVIFYSPLSKSEYTMHLLIDFSVRHKKAEIFIFMALMKTHLCLQQELCKL